MAGVSEWNEVTVGRMMLFGERVAAYKVLDSDLKEWYNPPVAA